MKMKLYRLTIMTPTGNVDRGVWAETLNIKDGCYIFRNFVEENDLVAAYPIASTFITNIETQEQYDRRKEISSGL